MIELVGFTKEYKKSFAVKSVSFLVPDGSVTGLLGENGSGKTTIIKAICGFHYPCRGKIFVSDYDGSKYEISECPQKAMELIGYVPEKTMLPGEMHVKDFLNYCAELHLLKNEEKVQAVNRVIKDCALEEVLDKKIKTLSKGFGQRVSFAQALIHNPPNLVLDEPISGLDPSQIIYMRKMVEKLSAKKAVLLSTHILQEVTSLCSSVCIMNKGVLVCSGSQEQIVKSYGAKTLEDAFIKSIQSAGGEQK